MGRTRAAEVAGMAVMEAIRSCSETSRRQAAVAVVRLVVMLSSCQGGAVVVVRMALAQSLPEAETRQSWVEVMAAAAMVKGCPEPGASSHLSSASAAAAAMALVEGGAGVGWATESPDRLFHIMTIACLGLEALLSKSAQTPQSANRQHSKHAAGGATLPGIIIT